MGDLPDLTANLDSNIGDFIAGLDAAKWSAKEFVATTNATFAAIKDAQVKVTADATGLRSEVDRAVAAAKAGQKIDVPVKADTSHVGPDVAGRLRDERGRFVAAGEDAGAALGEGIYRSADGRLRDASGRFVADGEDAGRKMGQGAGRGFASEFSKMNLGSTGMFSNLVPFILPAIAAVGALSGALALVPALAFAAGASLAAIAVGASGVSGAIKAYGQEQASAGVGAAQSAAQQLAAANSIISAQEGVRNAIRAVADAQRNAANSIISAQQSVANAVRAVASAEATASANVRSALQAQQRAEEALQSAQVSALRAQQNLTDARRAATRSLEDLQSRVTDDALAQRAAIAAVEDAQRALQATQSNSYASSQQVSAAQLAYDQAVQQLHNTSVAYERSKEDAAAAAAAGVEGSKQVISAQDGVLASQRALRDANTSVEDAAQKVTDAQVSGAQQIADANQRVADTQRALVNAQIDGAEQIQRAQEGVVTAQRNLNQAIVSAAASAASASGGVNKFNEAMAKLSPNAQAFVRELISLGPAWTALRLDVQQHLFAGLDTQVAHLGRVALPVLRTGLANMATSVNENVTEFTKWATSAKTVADMSRIFDNSALAAHNLAAAVRPVQDILRDITLVGSELLPGLASGFAASAQRAADFIRQARESGKLREWIQAGITAVGQLMSIFGDLIRIIARVTAAPGPNLLDFLKAITGSVLWLITNVPGLIPILEAVFVAWKLAQIAQGITTMIIGTQKLIQVIKEWTVVQWLLNAAMDANPIGVIILAIGALIAIGYLLIRNWDSIRVFAGEMLLYLMNKWNGFVDFLSGIGQRIWGVAGWMWNGIVSAAKWAANSVIDTFNGMITGVNLLIRGLNIVNPFSDIPYVPYIPHFARGGITAGGLAMVGEEGPELVDLPTGSRVTSHAASLRLLGPTTGDGGITVNVNVAGHVWATQDLARAIQQELIRHNIRNPTNATQYSFA